MTSTPHPNTPRWLLEVTAAAAPAGPAAFEEQCQLLRSVTAFHPASRTWGTYIGALDVRALTVLQLLYGAAQRFGTEIRIQVIAAPATWNGPCFTEAGELAALAAAEADHGRQLGQLPVS